jgi:hypothetical protein
MLIPLSTMCSLYPQWGKPEQAEPCNRQLLTILEKQYGPNSPVLVPVLSSEAQALRGMGHADQAKDVDNRLAAIRSKTMQPPTN